MTYLYKWFHCAGDKDKTNNEDDDILSASAMSIASSSSLASAVYERAKKRRDHFWSHQKHGRATNWRKFSCFVIGIFTQNYELWIFKMFLEF